MFPGPSRHPGVGPSPVSYLLSVLFQVLPTLVCDGDA